MMKRLRLHTYKDYQELINFIASPLNSYNECYLESVLPNPIYTNYSVHEQKIEFFSRSLLGNLFSNKIKTLPIIMRIIREGVNRYSPHYWGTINNKSQLIVEMFPILLFCIKNNTNFKIAFSNEDKIEFQQWFLQINNIEVCNNNWYFFPILINLFLQRLELEYSQQIIEKSWIKIDRMYLGNGWYSDGDSKQKDYYNSFAFHFYSLLYAFYSNDKKRINNILQRAGQFAQSFIHFFGKNGESIPYGRSLTYKFAHVAFWSIYSNFIKDTQQLGIIKGIVNRNLRWWLNKDIFDNNGLLINGYTYDNPYMLEQYNGSGSPYWAFKAFYCMLNPNSDYFNVEELPYPNVPQIKHIPEANLSIHHCNGHSFAFINGQHNPYFCNKTAKYEKFVYSTLFGFNISRSFETLDMLAPDSTLAIQIGNNIIIRNNTTIIHNDEQVQISDWKPIPSITIRSYIFMGAPWHIRVHYIISTIYFSLFDFSYAINAEDNKLQKSIRNNEIFIASSNSCCGIKAINGSANYLKCAPNTNILHPQNLLPFIHYNIKPGKTLHTTLVYGNVTENKTDLSYSIDNEIKIKNKHLIAFGKFYQLPKISIKYNIHIILINTYIKLSKIIQYLYK